ncbi:MAG: acyltransferase family protein [Nocardioidaceae bacterium]
MLIAGSNTERAERPSGPRASGSARSHSEPSLPYLPGLDGIRAIAVAAVLLYHAEVGWMPGGFLGVDVFFVLSGYLITSLLLAELSASGRIDLLRFWARRARRLLPAVVVVIAVCLVVIAAFYPADLARLRGDAAASLLYVQNWHLVLAERSYFEAFQRPSLLQHLWSLAIEEQFYLLWPVILGAGLAALGRVRVARVALAAAALSTLLMALLYRPGGDPSRVYFGTDTRAWVLLVGVLLALAWPPGRLGRRTGRHAGRVLNGVAALALGALLLAMLDVHDYDRWLYRGGLVLVALPSAALIAAVAHPACDASRLLGTQPLRWIGQRSYGIYLWHWPVMALTRPGIDLAWSPWLLVPAQLALTVCLAAASYRYVERPIRDGRALPRPTAWLAARAPRQRLAFVGSAATALVLAAVLVAARPVPSEGAGARVRSTAAAGATAPGGKAGWRRAAPLAVGASVMARAAPVLERDLGATVDAAVGRQASDVIARLQAYREAGRLSRRVVVQVGDNGPLTSEDLDRLRAVLRGVPQVVLVNVRVPRSWEAEVNAKLERAVSSWRDAALADWHSASADPSLLEDSAHPTLEGQRAYERVIDSALGYPGSRARAGEGIRDGGAVGGRDWSL